MRALRFIPDEAKLWTDDEGRPIAIVEITANCLQGRSLLSPSPRSTALYLGVLGQAQKLYRFPTFGYAALSTHHHWLIGVRSAEQLSAIMCYVHGNVAKEIGREIDWRGKFWNRRGVAIPVLSDADCVDRLSYLISHGVKENAVENAQSWPGPHAGKAFVSGKPEQGIWIDRSALYEKRRAAKAKGEKLPTEEEATTLHKIKLAKLPCWRHLSDKAYVRRIREMMQGHSKAAKRKRAAEGKRVQGIKSILAQDPHHRPDEGKRKKKKKKKTPAPLVHCADTTHRRQFKKAYYLFVGAYREALAALYAGVEEARFPNGGIPPGSTCPARARDPDG